MTTDAIKTEGLSKNYKGKRGKRIEALIDLDLQIHSGEVYGFLGPNGAGKSTTIKTLMGLITPSSGQAQLLDVPIKEARARLKVGYLPENPAFYDFLSAREYLAFVGKSFDMNSVDCKRESDKVLELVLLSEAADRPIRGYSKGMVQRLGLAQTLLHDPDLYLLDEPMSGLDPMGRAMVKEIIQELKERGKTVFFSSHITADVESVCDRVGVIVQGRLRTEQKVEEIMRSGIKGYKVCVRGAEDKLKSHPHRSISDDIVEYEIDRVDFNDFTGQVSRAGAVVELVEPVRSDLEAFFLDVVAKSSD